MSMRLKNIVKKLHLWLGLTCGMVIFIMTITGCMYAYKEELEPLIYPKKVELNEVTEQKLPVAILINKVEETFGLKVNRVVIPKANQPYFFRISKGNKKGLTYWGAYDYYYGVYVNPYNAQIVYTETQSDLFLATLNLHRKLWLRGALSKYVVGFSVVFFIFSIITGIIRWLPRRLNFKYLKKQLTYKSSKSFRVWASQVHRIFGVYLSVPLLIISISGLCWTFDAVKNTVFKTAEVFQFCKIERFNQPININPNDIYQSLIAYLDETYQYRKLRFTIKGDMLDVKAYPKGINNYNCLKMVVDKSSGYVLKVDDYNYRNSGKKVLSFNYDIHTKLLMGRFGQLLVFLICLLTISFPITGVFIYLYRKKFL